MPLPRSVPCAGPTRSSFVGTSNKKCCRFFMQRNGCLPVTSGTKRLKLREAGTTDTTTLGSFGYLPVGTQYAYIAVASQPRQSPKFHAIPSHFAYLTASSLALPHGFRNCSRSRFTARILLSHLHHQTNQFHQRSHTKPISANFLGLLATLSQLPVKIKFPQP